MTGYTDTSYDSLTKATDSGSGVITADSTGVNWDAGGYGTVKLQKGKSVIFEPSGQQVSMGLNSSIETGGNRYLQPDFSIHSTNSTAGNQVFESGTAVDVPSLAYQAGIKYKIEYTNASTPEIIYYKDTGSGFSDEYTSLVEPSGDYYIQISFGQNSASCYSKYQAPDAPSSDVLLLPPQVAYI